MFVNHDDHRQRLQRLLLVVLLFHMHNNILFCHYLHCPGIAPPSESLWQRLYVHADPNSFLHMTGLTQGECFALLIADLFAPDEIAHGRDRSAQKGF